MKFEELGLNEAINRAIAELGFVEPTPIQEQAIPVLITNRRQDLVALAQTGTGKTAAFGLPLIQQIDFTHFDTQAIVLCPTRELCMQITRDLLNFSKYIRNASVVPIYGGASIEKQIREIRSGAHIIVCTPGRMVDMIERGVIKIQGVETVVLDEADEMLHMGFKEDLDRILAETPSDKNTWLFSATMPDEVLRISRTYMSNPYEVTVGRKNQGNENIEHCYYVVHARDRYLALKRIADYNPNIFAIVFCRTKLETQEIADSLIKDGYNADALHGDLSQAQRDYVMKRYRNRALQLLVATDVAARGIDVNDVTHVINYNLPDDVENYTHRSGRTARAGKKGVSIAIINMKEQYRIREIERHLKTTFTKLQVPTGFEVCEQQLLGLIGRVQDVDVDQNAIGPYMEKALEALSEFSREDIIQRFISYEFNHFLDYYRNAPDLNVQAERGEKGQSRPGVVKLYMNIGQLEGFDFNSIKDFIAQAAGIDSKQVEWAEVKNTFSLIEVRTEVYEKVMQALHGSTYKKRTIRIESRGSKENDIPRTRLRSDKGGGGGGRRDFGRDRGDRNDRGGQGGKRSFNKSSGGSGGKKEKPWEQFFGDAKSGDKKKKKKR